MSSSPISRTERLLNLVIALLSTKTPLSRAAIQASVAGYDTDTTVAAFERMFERDKDELRGMGVPIRTVTDAHGEVRGYVIDAEEYAVADLALTAEEVTVLNLAAQIWDQAVLESAALTAVRKLESTSTEGMASATQTFGILTARDAALLPLMRGVRDHKVVRFEYRKPGEDAPRKRMVEPWRLHSKDGHWYLVGWDQEKEGQRVFRVSRIVGAVQVTAIDTHPRPMDSGMSIGFDPGDDIVVEVRIPSGVGAELRRLPGVRALDEETFVITGPRQQILTLLWRSDPSVRIISPAELRERHREGLARLEAEHT